MTNKVVRRLEKRLEEVERLLQGLEGKKNLTPEELEALDNLRRERAEILDALDFVDESPLDWLMGEEMLELVVEREELDGE